MSVNNQAVSSCKRLFEETIMHKTLLIVFGVAIAMVVVPSAASAQNERAKVKRVPVSVVLTSSFPYSGDVVILRRPELIPSDLIVMRAEAATPAIFSEAVRDLLDIRRIAGDSPQAGALLRSRLGDSKSRRNPLPWSERVLTDARAKPFEAYAEFSNAQLIQIWLPAKKKAK
jgi:hypothetical protein